MYFAAPEKFNIFVKKFHGAGGNILLSCRLLQSGMAIDEILSVTDLAREQIKELLK